MLADLIRALTRAADAVTRCAEAWTDAADTNARAWESCDRAHEVIVGARNAERAYWEASAPPRTELHAYVPKEGTDK
jgi:hypothetical protein